MHAAGNAAMQITAAVAAAASKGGEQQVTFAALSLLES